jgi:hypothetical protein
MIYGKREGTVRAAIDCRRNRRADVPQWQVKRLTFTASTNPNLVGAVSVDANHWAHGFLLNAKNYELLPLGWQTDKLATRHGRAHGQTAGCCDCLSAAEECHKTAKTREDGASPGFFSSSLLPLTPILYRRLAVEH